MCKMAKVYCVKCREKTANDGEGEESYTKNGRRMLKVPCAKCGTTKCRFLKSED